MKTKLVRKGFEEILKLKRNVINFHDMGIDFPLSLNFNETDSVGFSLETKQWTVRSSTIISNNWNPTKLEVIEFLKNYTAEELLLAIKKMEEISNEGYKSINAVLAKPKFHHVMGLMSLPENQIQPLLKIVIKTVLKDSKDKIIYEIAFVDGKFVFSLEFPSEGVMTGWSSFNEKELNQILREVPYFDIISALNTTHKHLLKKTIGNDKTTGRIKFVHRQKQTSH